MQRRVLVYLQRGSADAHLAHFTQVHIAKCLRFNANVYVITFVFRFEQLVHV